MDETAFWELIDRARGEGAGPKTPSVPPEALRAVLEGESDATIQGFVREYGRQLVRLNRWPVWGAGYVIAGGMSDDGFHYFRSWLIGKGQVAVERALADPDGLGEFVEDPEEVDNGPLEYVAAEIMEARGGEDPRREWEDSPDGEPEDEPFDEESVYAACPRLAAAFG